MSKEFKFFMYLIQNYAYERSVTPIEVFNELREKKLYDFVLNSYEVYHIEDLNNAFAEIDNLLRIGKIA